LIANLEKTSKDWSDLAENSTHDVKSLKVGDRISVIQKTGDVEGVILQLPRFAVGEIKLSTDEGVKLIPVTARTYIHLIRSAEQMAESLKLNDHTEYDRDQEDFLKNTHRNDGREEFEAEIDPKSKMPRSKICLNLRKKTNA
jgi:hypothetical protein